MRNATGFNNRRRHVGWHVNDIRPDAGLAPGASRIGLTGDQNEVLYHGINNVNLRAVPALGFRAQVIRNFSYMNKNGEEHTITLANNADYCHLGIEGYIRYNSKLVRWQEWFCQLQRVNRHLMRKQLSWVQQPVVNKSDAVAEEVTEYQNNNVFNADDFM